jgi:hypothetical protein
MAGPSQARCQPRQQEVLGPWLPHQGADLLEPRGLGVLVAEGGGAQYESGTWRPAKL